MQSASLPSFSASNHHVAAAAASAFESSTLTLLRKSLMASWSLTGSAPIISKCLTPFLNLHPRRALQPARFEILGPRRQARHRCASHRVVERAGIEGGGLHLKGRHAGHSARRCRVCVCVNIHFAKLDVGKLVRVLLKFWRYLRVLRCGRSAKRAKGRSKSTCSPWLGLRILDARLNQDSRESFGMPADSAPTRANLQCRRALIQRWKPRTASWRRPSCS